MVGQKVFTTLSSSFVPSTAAFVHLLVDELPAFPLCCCEANADKQELCGFEKPRMKAFHELAFSLFLDIFLKKVFRYYRKRMVAFSSHCHVFICF
jgi:hypothetical protein